MRHVIIAAALSLLTSPVLAAQCLIVVEDQTKLSGPCKIDRYARQVVVGASGRITYFAIVPPGGGEAFWNEERGAGHAHTPLGEVTQSGACWLGRNARICAWD